MIFCNFADSFSAYTLMDDIMIQSVSEIVSKYEVVSTCCIPNYEKIFQ